MLLKIEKKISFLLLLLYFATACNRFLCRETFGELTPKIERNSRGIMKLNPPSRFFFSPFLAGPATLARSQSAVTMTLLKQIGNYRPRPPIGPRRIRCRWRRVLFASGSISYSAQLSPVWRAQGKEKKEMKRNGLSDLEEKKFFFPLFP